MDKSDQIDNGDWNRKGFSKPTRKKEREKMKSMKIIEEHAKANIFAGGGVSYAEVKVIESFDDRTIMPKEYYVIYTLGEGESYGVSEMSVNDPRITEGGELLNYIEEYSNMFEAKKSRFSEYFIIAERMMNEIG